MLVINRPGADARRDRLLRDYDAREGFDRDLMYVNPLMVQDILASPDAPALAAEDLRGLTPLFWRNVAPYGEVRLDLTDRLSLR